MDGVWGGVMGRKGVWMAVFWGLALAVGVLALCQRWQEVVEAAANGVLTVCPGVVCDHTTIQAAVDAAQDGAVIKVAEGVYTGVQPHNDIDALIYIGGKDRKITIRGGYAVGEWDVSDPDAHPTILDAEGQRRVLVVNNEEGGGEVIVEGVSIVGGYASETIAGGWGGGAYFYNNAKATLRHSVISGNVAIHGGGVFIHGSKVDVVGCHIVANTAITYGGGLVLFISDDTQVVSSTIAANEAQLGGGVYLYRSNRTTMINNFYVDNSGDDAGAIYVAECDRPRLIHTTIARNLGDSGVKVVSDSEWEMVNTIIAGHTVGLDVANDSHASLEATLWHDNGTDWQGNVSRRSDYDGDPAFVDPDAGDYHIKEASAAQDRGVAAGVFVDFDGDERPRGGGYDIGADEFPNTLAVSLSATPVWVRPGDRLTYVIQLSNFETTTLAADITNTLPAQVQPTGVLAWPSQPISPGKETWEQQIPVTVSAACQGIFVNEVEVATEGGDRFKRALSLGCFSIYLPLVTRAYQ